MLQLLDGRVPVLRTTIELISGVESTPDLLNEIQQQNEGRIFTKFFMSESSVIACADLRCIDLLAQLTIWKLLVRLTSRTL